MRKMILSLMALALLLPAVSLSAQNQEISDADRAAVAAYNEAGKKLDQNMREARKEIREKNAALAKALGRDKADYKEGDVMVAHKALIESYAKLNEAELGRILLYKTYNPQWKPADDGRRVTLPNERARGRDDDEPVPGEAKKK